MFNMSKAALIKFKNGVTNEEIAKALNGIQHLLDIPRTVPEGTYTMESGRKVVRYESIGRGMFNS